MNKLQAFRYVPLLALLGAAVTLTTLAVAMLLEVVGVLP